VVATDAHYEEIHSAHLVFLRSVRGLLSTRRNIPEDATLQDLLPFSHNWPCREDKLTLCSSALDGAVGSSWRPRPFIHCTHFIRNCRGPWSGGDRKMYGLPATGNAVFYVACSGSVYWITPSRNISPNRNSSLTNQETCYEISHLLPNYPDCEGYRWERKWHKACRKLRNNPWPVQTPPDVNLCLTVWLLYTRLYTCLFSDAISTERIISLRMDWVNFSSVGGLRSGRTKNRASIPERGIFHLCIQVQSTSCSMRDGSFRQG
jgi:hypothetical protein